MFNHSSRSHRYNQFELQHGWQTQQTMQIKYILQQILYPMSEYITPCQVSFGFWFGFQITYNIGNHKNRSDGYGIELYGLVDDWFVEAIDYIAQWVAFYSIQIPPQMHIDSIDRSIVIEDVIEDTHRIGHIGLW